MDNIYIIDNMATASADARGRRDACHRDGRAVPPPEDFDYDTAFLDGDFVETVRDGVTEEGGQEP